MARKVLKLAPQPVAPPVHESDGEAKRAPPERKQLPSREEVLGWISELEAQLASDDTATVQAASRLCRRLSLVGVQRLGVILTGAQPGTVPQIVMSAIAVLKGAGIMKGEAGIVAETTTE
jgi:hypothetical protein